MEDSFYGAPGFLRYRRNARGQVCGFEFSHNGMIDIHFDRR
jgi:hypothetical protein